MGVGEGDLELSLEESRMWPQGKWGVGAQDQEQPVQRPWGGGSIEAIETILPVHFVHSCAEKLQSDEQFSKNLFGPPLESAFDHEDFTGDGGRGFWGTASVGRRLGGAVARVGGRVGQAGGSP